MLKSEKIKFVNELGNEISNYKGVAIMPLNGVPDRLLQSIRNQLKPGAKIVVARKNLLLKAFEKSGKAEKLKNYVDGDVALLLTNDDPFSVYKKITGKVLKLGAKPSQIAPQDIFISKAYAEAVKLGLDAEIYDTGITDLLLAKASAQAGALNGKVNVNA